MSYEILEHTADEKFRTEGDSIEEAFSEAVKAFGKIVGSDPEAGEHRHRIELEAENSEALLFDFLDKLIFLQDTEGVAVCHAEDLVIHEKRNSYLLEATIWTDPIDHEDSYQDIKAPTYNEMKVDYEKERGWIVEAVLDI